MSEAGDDELEFHLGTLLVDLRAIDHMSGASREAWAYTVQPLIAHAAGVCHALASITAEEPAQCARELAVAIAQVHAPESDETLSSPGRNEAAWKWVRDKHLELVHHFAGRGINTWVMGRRPTP